MVIGIDDIATYIPPLYLDLTSEFAEARNIHKDKLLAGVGIEHMAVADVNEDAATLAASSILKLIEKSNINPQDVGRIYIGTESGVDESKAMGGYVIGMLEKALGKGAFQQCGTVEFKFACIGATYALDSALSWVGSPRSRGRIAIVVASDIARYDLKSAGEYTQGAGSVAMSITRNPRLLEIEEVNAAFTKDENDFFRPVGRRTAVFDSEHSVNCYLNAMKAVMMDYGRSAVKDGMVALGEGDAVSDYVNHMVFHIPFPRMAEYAAAFLFRHEWRDLPRWKDIESDIGAEPDPMDYVHPEKLMENLKRKTNKDIQRSDFKDDKAMLEHALFEMSEEDILAYCIDTDAYLKADRDFRKKFTKHPVFQKTYREKIEPSIVISRKVGNIYTGSLYLGLQSLLEVLHGRGENLSGRRIGFASYGSGCSSMAYSGVVRPKYVEVVGKMNMMEELKTRSEIDLNTYEDIHNGKLEEPIAKNRGFVLRNVSPSGYRNYELIRN